MDSYQFGLDLAFGVPFRGPLGMALWGVILFRRDPPLGPFARFTVMGGPPWEGKKTIKTLMFIAFHEQGKSNRGSTYGQAVGPFCSRRSGCTSALLGGPGGTGVGPAVAHIFALVVLWCGCSRHRFRCALLQHRPRESTPSFLLLFGCIVLLRSLQPVCLNIQWFSQTWSWFSVPCSVPAAVHVFLLGWS